MFFFVVFLVDYVINIVAANPSSRFSISFIGISYLLSLLPIISLVFNFVTGSSSLNFLISLNFFYCFRIVNIFAFVQRRQVLEYENQLLEETPTFKLNEITYQIFRLVVFIALFLLCASGTVLCLSINNPTAFIVTGIPTRLTWLDSIYFVVVTGTISPFILKRIE